MILILIGAPGAGKGTQADLLVDKLGFYKISTGDALRRQIALGTDVGAKAEGFINAGKLVPDDVLVDVLKAELSAAGGKPVLLDGYPRNLAQAKTLDSLSDEFPVSKAVHLDVPQEKLLARLTGRRVCKDCGASFHMESMRPKVDGVCDRCGGELYQRSDDQEEKISVRLGVYAEETSPVLEYYQSKGLYARLDGDRDAFAIFSDLESLA